MGGEQADWAFLTPLPLVLSRQWRGAKRHDHTDLNLGSVELIRVLPPRGGGFREQMSKTVIILPVLVLLAYSLGNAHAGSGQARSSTVAVRLDFRITIPSFLRLSYELNDPTTLQVAAVTGPGAPVILDTGASRVLRFAGGGHHSLSIDPPAVAFSYDPEGEGDQTLIYTLSSP